MQQHRSECSEDTCNVHDNSAQEQTGSGFIPQFGRAISGSVSSATDERRSQLCKPSAVSPKHSIVSRFKLPCFFTDIQLNLSTLVLWGKVRLEKLLESYVIQNFLAFCKSERFNIMFIILCPQPCEFSGHIHTQLLREPINIIVTAYVAQIISCF